MFGIVGCILCLVGSTSIVINAPQERPIHSVTEVWSLATEPGNLFTSLVSCYEVPKDLFHFRKLFLTL